MSEPSPEEIARGLTKTQARGLLELCAATKGGWCRGRDLSGTAAERSARNMRALFDKGLARGIRYNNTRQAQWSWMATSRGRAVAAALAEMRNQ